jgi:DNA-binding NtrC family response regulator
MQSRTTYESGSVATPKQCMIWVWDADPIRREQILEILSTACGISARTVTSVHELSFGAKAGGIIFSSSNAGTTSTDLKLIATLRAKFAFIMYLIAGGRDSDLATMCRILLAGVTQVLDVQAKDFLLELRACVEQAAERMLAIEAEEEILRSIMSAAGFAGRSAAVCSLFRSLRSISSMTELPVLISGETGTGKELIASAIHAQDSKRSRQPFVCINCAALPEQLSESELFGHQRGAYTGAERERAGLFRSAEGGVLFLDEVGELSPSLQSKLLRVLQTNRLRSVGADREVTINVRVVAATNRSLEQMVREGTFREDLFHRLNVLSLSIPPLRERSDDIGPLVEHFIEKYCALWQAKGKPAIGNDFIHGLEKSILPGNARQVENIVRRALVKWEGNRPFSLTDLPPEIWRELSGTAVLEPLPETPAPAPSMMFNPALEAQAIEYLQRHNWDLPHAIRYLESALVRGALTATGGNQSEAARLLGITPRSIYNKLHKDCPS